MQHRIISNHLTCQQSLALLSLFLTHTVNIWFKKKTYCSTSKYMAEYVNYCSFRIRLCHDKIGTISIFFHNIVCPIVYITEHFIRNLLSRASFCFQNGLNSLRHVFHKMLKTLLWDSVPCWHDCITQFPQIGQLHIHAANLPFYHILKVFYWIHIQWLGKPLKNIELIVTFMKPD